MSALRFRVGFTARGRVGPRPGTGADGMTCVLMVEDEPFPDLPTRVVATSAMKQAALLSASAAHEPDLILPKPFDLARLPIGLDRQAG